MKPEQASLVDLAQRKHAARQPLALCCPLVLMAQRGPDTGRSHQGFDSASLMLGDIHDAASRYE